MSASSSSANVPSEIIDACTCSVMLVGDSSDFGQLRSISFQRQCASSMQIVSLTFTASKDGALHICNICRFSTMVP